jgi:trehalose 6-phosphate synthase
MARLVVVSNRVAPIQEGEATAGGLAAGVLDALKQKGGLWFGWSGDVTDTSEHQPKRPSVERTVGPITLFTIDLSRKDYDEYYRGFANDTLWPVLHYQIGLGHFEWPEFEGYLRVNDLFAAALAPLVRPDDLIWVYDYHLLCLADAMRARGLGNRIGLFLHTPFPAPGVFMTIPSHAALIQSMCAYDLLGFQTEIDRTAFIDYVLRQAGGSSINQDTVSVFGRTVPYRRLPHRCACRRSSRPGGNPNQPAPGNAHARQPDGTPDPQRGPPRLLEGTAPAVCRVRAVPGRVPRPARVGDLHADRATLTLRHRDLSAHPP